MIFLDHRVFFNDVCLAVFISTGRWLSAVFSLGTSTLLFTFCLCLFVLTGGRFCLSTIILLFIFRLTCIAFNSW